MRKATPAGQIATTAVYTRISEDRQNGAGVERQLEDCQDLARNKGWAVVDVFADNDISASKYTRRRRPRYRELLAAVHAGNVKRIVAWKLDRLYRQPKELEELIDLAEAGQVEIVSVMGGEINLNTSAGRTMARVGVAMAAGASDDTSERIVRQKQQRRNQGLPTGGPRPFGWNKDQRTRHPKESRLLLAAMDAVLSGASLSDVARLWTASKVRNRAWGSNDVTRALTMPRHAGLVVHHGEIIGTGQWKPLLPRARWEQVCAAVNGRSRFAGLPRRRSMLTGILLCGSCGAPMVRSSGVKGAKLWRCHEGPRRAGCGKVSIKADLVEPIVVEATWQRVDTLNLAALLTNDDDRPDYADVAQQLADLERREDDAASSFGAGRITVRSLERITADLAALRQTLRARLARHANRDALSSYAGRTGALRAAWELLTDDQRRTIIAEALGKVTILATSTPGARFDRSRIVLG